jgi:hypothetical protein
MTLTVDLLIRYRVLILLTTHIEVITGIAPSRKSDTLNLGLCTHQHLPQAECARAVHYHSGLEITKKWLK